MPYSEYPRFHKLMAEESGEVFDAALIDVILPMAYGLPERLRAGADVADFGCGSGHAINLVAQRFQPVGSPASTSPRRVSRTVRRRPSASPIPTRRSSSRMWPS